MLQPLPHFTCNPNQPSIIVSPTFGSMVSFHRQPEKTTERGLCPRVKKSKHNLSRRRCQQPRTSNPSSLVGLVAFVLFWLVSNEFRQVVFLTNALSYLFECFRLFFHGSDTVIPNNHIFSFDVTQSDPHLPLPTLNHKMLLLFSSHLNSRTC